MIRTLFGRVAQTVERSLERRRVVGATPTPATISRRQFLAWAVATPVIAIPAVKYFLPPAGGWPVDYGLGDFTTASLRFKSYERHSLGGTDVRAIYGTSDGVALNSAAHPYLTSDTAWFLKTEDEAKIRKAGNEARAQYYHNALGVPADVSRQSLEDMVIWLQEQGERVVIYPGRKWWKS